MDSVTPHLGFADGHALDVHCPDCAESFVVALEVIEDCQQMLDERGYCTGPASYECPAPYFAGLATPTTLVHMRELALATSAQSRDISDLARWEDDGGTAAS